MPQEVNRNGEAKLPKKTPEQALASLMRYCSRAERSSGDAMRLMRGWNIAVADAQAILARLRRERFIDDARFAGAYVRDRSRLAGWGPHKIRAGLRAKGIAPETIEAALSETECGEPLDRLRGLMEKKAAGLKGGTVYERKAKLMRFGLSRGFDYESVAELCDRILKDDR